uniref:Putative vacuolar h+-atpase v0 sector accessory subunit s1 ac45 n=1 Tax=Haematobia irritans TaxID=7368 RepID=A0A1L8EEW2_HAEIR
MKYLIGLLCVLSLALAEQSPVFLWGVNSVAKPSLKTIPQSDFTNIIASHQNGKTLVVFLENGLTNKDFTCSNAQTTKSCFVRLQEVPQKNFFASVENPVEALRSIGNHEYNSIDSSGKLAHPIDTGKANIVFVVFDDESDFDRTTCLESHDSVIAEIASELNDKAIFMYTTAPHTSSNKSLKRERRAADDNPMVFQDGSKLLMYFTSLTVVDSKEATTTVLTPQGMEVTTTNATAMSVKLTSTPPLTFDITLSGGYFFMTNVLWNGIQFRSNDVYSPTDFSYFCGNLTLYGKGTIEEQSTYTLNWNSFQFQAPFGSTTNEQFVFGDPWHCVGFFTGAILSGLLIVVLLLTITFVGVCWMMDINTMDRFDDPKGKTITINASE